MKLEEILGKTITNIRCLYGLQDGWLETAACYIELDNTITIRIPIGECRDVYRCDPDKDAISLFNNLEDHPVYHINAAGNPIGKMTAEDFKPHKVENRENSMKYIPSSKIVDVIWYNDGFDENAFLVLDSGWLITETIISPSGTGHTGLNIWKLDELVKQRGKNYSKLSDRIISP